MSTMGTKAQSGQAVQPGLACQAEWMNRLPFRAGTGISMSISSFFMFLVMTLLIPIEAQAQQHSLVIGIRSALSAGGTDASITAGLEQKLSMTGRFRSDSLRVSFSASAGVFAWHASALQWVSYSESQTLRWSIPAWSAGASPAPDYLAELDIGEAAIAISGPNVRFEAGKFPLSWGTGRAFRPTDLFRTVNPLSSTAEARSLPAVRFTAFPGPLQRIEAAAAIDGAGTASAGVRMLSTIGNAGVFALNGGWRRTYPPSVSLDEYSIGLALQHEWGLFGPCAELSMRYCDGSFSAHGMAGVSLTASRLSLRMELQERLDPIGNPLTMPDMFLAVTWNLSDLTVLSFPILWFPESKILSIAANARFEGIFHGRLELSGYIVRNILAGTPSFRWLSSLAWSRALQ